MNRAAALKLHGDLSDELAGLHRERAAVLAAERDAKVKAFNESPGSDKVREHYASFNALNSTKEAWRIEGEIRALQEQRDHLRLVLAYGEDL